MPCKRCYKKKEKKNDVKRKPYPKHCKPYFRPFQFLEGDVLNFHHKLYHITIM